MKIELLQRCSAGKRGDVLEVVDDIGETLIMHNSAKRLAGEPVALEPADKKQDEPVKKGKGK